MPWTDILAARLALVQKKDEAQGYPNAIQNLIDYLNGKQTLESGDSELVDAYIASSGPELPAVPDSEA